MNVNVASVKVCHIERQDRRFSYESFAPSYVMIFFPSVFEVIGQLTSVILKTEFV
jgi:hypothetical protein